MALKIYNFITFKFEAVWKDRGIILNTKGYSPSSFTYGAECKAVGGGRIGW